MTKGREHRAAETEEAILLVRHREGDPEAFAELVHAYRRVVYSHLSRSSVPLEDRDDLFQEIFLKLHRSAETYDESRSLQPWLFTLVANTVRNNFRKQRVRQLVSAKTPGDQKEIDTMADPRPSASDEAVSRQRARRLGVAIAALSLPLRQVLLLVTVEGLTMQETATCLEIPLNTVKTRLRRARLSLLESQRENQSVAKAPRESALRKSTPSSFQGSTSKEKPPQGKE